MQMYVTTCTIHKGEEYLEYLPTAVGTAFRQIAQEERDKITEIRIKNDGYTAVSTDRAHYLKSDGSMSDISTDGIFVGAGIFRSMIDRMCHSSVYAAQSELRAGFITLSGGHRVGVCGKTVVERGRIVSLSDISGVNIRIAREIPGAANGILRDITDGTVLRNTLIISPPACGKTTILRDAARQLGGGTYAFKVGVVDERGEIAAMYRGKAYNDIGALTDVYTNCPKAQGMTMLLRAMSPDVIITDEIGTEEDEEAVFTTINAGVKVICSVHGYDLDDLHRRGLLSTLIAGRIFDKIIVLSGRNGVGTIEKIY